MKRDTWMLACLLFLFRKIFFLPMQHKERKLIITFVFFNPLDHEFNIDTGLTTSRFLQISHVQALSAVMALLLTLLLFDETIPIICFLHFRLKCSNLIPR